MCYCRVSRNTLFLTAVFVIKILEVTTIKHRFSSKKTLLFQLNSDIFRASHLARICNDVSSRHGICLPLTILTEFCSNIVMYLP